MKLIRFIARFKARQTRGSAWVQLLLNMGIITANIKLFQSWFESFGISINAMLAIGVLSFLFGTITIGFLDEQYGVWQHENEYNSNLNPVMRKIQERLDEIKGLLLNGDVQ